MSAISGEQHAPDTEPNFSQPRRSVITETNWPEYQAKGFEFLRNQKDPTDATYCSEIYNAEKFFGRQNVYTGHAFDFTEGRPLANKPGVGIYIGPGGDHELAHSFRERYTSEEQPE